MKIFYQFAVMLLKLSLLFLPRHFAVFNGRGELGRVSNKMWDSQRYNNLEGIWFSKCLPWSLFVRELLALVGVTLLCLTTHSRGVESAMIKKKAACNENAANYCTTGVKRSNNRDNETLALLYPFSRSIKLTEMSWHLLWYQITHVRPGIFG